MTTIKSVVWAVTAHRSYKFGPYVTLLASKDHKVITGFSRECQPPPHPPVKTCTKEGTMWWPANFSAVSRVQLLVNREPESFWREAKMMIPNGLTRDDPSSMPQSLPLVSKPISNHHKMDIVCIPVSYWSKLPNIMLNTHWSTIGPISVLSAGQYFTIIWSI